jgi:hypothetical protein
MYDLQTAGLDSDNKEFIRDISFAMDALRATVYRAFGVNHPLQEFIDTNVKLLSEMSKEEADDETLRALLEDFADDMNDDSEEIMAEEGC